MSGLSSTARTVLLTLWVLADGWPRPWPSMTELAQASGLSRAQVLAGLDELRAAGVL
jgi:biotin operon repressor